MKKAKETFRGCGKVKVWDYSNGTKTIAVSLLLSQVERLRLQMQLSNN